MNVVTRLILAIFLLLVSLSAFSQVPDSVYYDRLYKVCKVWGHVKYYHTETAKGNVNWDEVLLNAVHGIKTAPDNNAFNDSLLSMLDQAGVMGTSPVYSPGIIDSLNNNKDYSWIQNSMFSDSVKARLDTIKTRFRSQPNVYVDEAWSGGNPTFDNDNSYHTMSGSFDEKHRVLALFRYWNIINYFYPYKNIMDQNWDSTLQEFIPQIIGVPSYLEYNLTFKRLTTRINDSHAFFYSPHYQNWLGRSYPPFQVRFIEGEMVITKVLPSVNEVEVGDVITEIDGKEIHQLRDSLRAFAAGSNEVIIDRELNSILMRGASGNFPITVDNGSQIHSEILNRDIYNYGLLNANTDPIWKDTTTTANCHIGIVDMGRLETTDIDNMFTDLWGTDLIIFDIRNYPNGTLWEIVNYLYSSTITIAQITVPDIYYPGRMYWTESTIYAGSSNPYAGNIVMLFDERTQSQAEWTCMGLEQFPNATKIGSTTSAADGNVSKIFLPGGMNTYATFLGVFYPDYTPTQRVGIVPDYEVHPTISGIRSGVDEVMEFALNCSLVGVEEPQVLESVKIYPNPASNKIHYDLINETAILIEIFDIQGKRVKQINNPAITGEIDISEWNRGIYLLKIQTPNKTVTQVVVKQ